MLEIPIGRNDAGQRLDRFLRKLLPSATLGHLFKLVRTGKVKLNGRKGKPETRLTEGDTLAFYLSDEQIDALRERRGKRSAPKAKSREDLRFLLRDEHVLAVDKPPFLVVQAGGSPDEATLEELVRERIGPAEGLTFQPSLAHRLDRGTSGVILFGVSAEGLRGLTDAFRRHAVTKRYVALVEGTPDEAEFLIDEPLLRHEGGDGHAAKVRVSHHPDAQEAQTEVTVLARSKDGRFTLVEARPLTGRTHQIRVHLRSRKLPIVGDPRYGRPALNREARDGAGLWRSFLHARSLEFWHPVHAGQQVRIESPLPQDLRRALAWAGISWRPRPARGDE